MKIKTFFGLIFAVVLLGALPPLAKADPIEDAKQNIQDIIARRSGKMMSLPVHTRELPTWKIR